MLHMGLAPHRGPCSQLHLQKVLRAGWCHLGCTRWVPLLGSQIWKGNPESDGSVCQRSRLGSRHCRPGLESHAETLNGRSNNVALYLLDGKIYTRVKVAESVLEMVRCCPPLHVSKPNLFFGRGGLWMGQQLSCRWHVRWDVHTASHWTVPLDDLLHADGHLS